jgi:hypothetical protein
LRCRLGQMGSRYSINHHWIFQIKVYHTRKTSFS